MTRFTTTIDLPAGRLPADYVRYCNTLHNDEPYQAADEVPDVQVEVEYNEGYFQSGCRSGHPDNWTPDEGEDPEVLSVVLEDDDPFKGGQDLVNNLPRAVFDRLVREAWEDQQQCERDARYDRY